MPVIPPGSHWLKPSIRPFSWDPHSSLKVFHTPMFPAWPPGLESFKKCYFEKQQVFCSGGRGMKLEMFWNLSRKIYLKGLDPTLQSFSTVPHCLWKTRVGTGMKGTGPEDYVAVN